MTKQYNDTHSGNNRSGGHYRRRGSNNYNADNRTDNRNAASSPESFLPPANVLQEYEYAAEGTVARLLAMAEKEQTHRHRIERHLALSYRLGQIFACTVLLSVAGGSVYLSQHNQEIPSFVLLMVGFLALVLTAAINRSNRNSRGKQKRPFNHRSHHRNNASNTRPNSTTGDRNNRHVSSDRNNRSNNDRGPRNNDRTHRGNDVSKPRGM